LAVLNAYPCQVSYFLLFDSNGSGEANKKKLLPGFTNTKKSGGGIVISKITDGDFWF
jgi:hypothetical protein